MMTKTRILAGTGAFALALALMPATASAQAVATGTAAGTDILNQATIGYTVGGVPQQAVDASNTFKVDRKITMVLDEVGNVTTTVAPGQTNAVTTFTLQNLTNGPMDFALAAINETDAATKHGGTDTFNVNNLRIFEDTNNDGVWTAADTQITFVDELAAGTTKRLFVVADVPTVSADPAVVNGAVAEIRLTATARESGVTGTQGGAITVATTNTDAMESVFAEAAGQGDAANNGVVINKDDYTVAAALLSMVKQSRIVSTSVGGLTTSLAIPGSTVEYCIRVRNAAGGATANGVEVVDTLVSQLSYVAGSLRVGGTTTVDAGGAVTCNADGTAASTVSGQTVTGTIGSIAAGEERTVVFQALIS